MKQTILLAYPLPRHEARERAWKAWEAAFSIAWKRNGGRMEKAEHVGLGICYYAGGSTPVPVYATEAVSKQLEAVGCLESAKKQIRCVTFSTKQPEKPFRKGNIVLTVEGLKK